MAGMTLYIGYRNTSSWSLRGWLMMRKSGLDFTVEQLRYREEPGRARLLEVSPTAKVPVLVEERGGRTLRVWETIAIGEFLAERCPGRSLWPSSGDARALARAVSAEIHAGFAVMRNRLPMNIAGRDLTADLDELALRADIARVEAIWTECRVRHGGAGGHFLFGAYGIADAMYAPVAVRLRSYGVRLEPIAQAYADALLADADFRAWESDAAGELAA